MLASGRIKHMNHTMNEVLGRYFGTVTASLGRQKSRVLSARRVRQPADRPVSRFPLHAAHDLGLEAPVHLRAYAQTFGGAKLDPGTRFLLEHLQLPAGAENAVDLGCGNGTIAHDVHQHPDAGLVQRVEHAVEVLQRADLGGDVAVVVHVVAAVGQC